MNIMVTGGFGVNGAWVTRKLVERGFRPVVLENRIDYSILGNEMADRIDLVQGDVTDLDGLVQVMRDREIQRVIHMAAFVGPPHEQMRLGFLVNALGTVNILEAARMTGATRVVFTSSRAAYGSITGASAHPTYAPIREDDPSRPLNPYDVQKVASEGMGANYARLGGVEFVALRFAAIYGPGKGTRHGPFGIFSLMIENALAGIPTTIAKGGEQRDDVLYVDDMAEGTILATLHDRPGHTLYNISRNIGTTLHDFAEAVQASIPGAVIEIGPGIDYLNVGGQYFGIMDNSRAIEDLGFQPRFDLRAGVAHYIRTISRRSTGAVG